MKFLPKWLFQQEEKIETGEAAEKVTIILERLKIELALQNEDVLETLKLFKADLAAKKTGEQNA